MKLVWPEAFVEEHSGEGEAYMPVLEILGKLCRGSHRTVVMDLVERYAPTWLVAIATSVHENGLILEPEDLLPETDP